MPCYEQIAVQVLGSLVVALLLLASAGGRPDPIGTRVRTLQAAQLHGHVHALATATASRRSTPNPRVALDAFVAPAQRVTPFAPRARVAAHAHVLVDLVAAELPPPCSRGPPAIG